jgi:hypothetical protein
MKLRIAFVLGLLVASLCVLPALAYARASKPLPFKAHATGFAGPPPSGPPPWPMDVFGSAVASYMASPVAVYQHHLVKPTSDPNILIFYDGTYVWTAADGEVMKGIYAGYLKMNVNTGLFEIHGVFVISGGTGKFKHAIGGGVASGTQSPINGAADLWLDGFIIFSRIDL